MKFLSLFALVTAASAAPSFVSQYENDYKSLKSNRGGSVLDVIREDKRFSKFVDILENNRGLRDDLEKAKQLTMFVPTNEAFEKHQQAFGKKSDEEIEATIRYHAAPEAEITGDCLHAGALIPTSLRLKTLGDRHQRIRVFRFMDHAWLNMKARVLEKDIKADNGIVHAIDSVLVPPENVGEMLYSVPTVFSTFLLASERTGVCDQARKHKGGLTAFAPTNAAWTQLGLENLKFLFSCVGQKTENRRSSGSEEVPWCKGTEVLEQIMQNHIAKQLVWSTDIIREGKTELETLGDEKVTVCAKKSEGREGRKSGEHKDVREYRFTVNNGEARVQFTDGLASNGAIQVIDNVLIPRGVRLPHALAQ